MSRAPVDRRAFLRTMGVSAGGVFVGLSGCDLTSPSIEEGVETVTSYMDPQDWVIPGKEIWYASTCTQCPAGCGLHARVREGIVRKLEGNPDSAVNAGRLCAAGQAGLQQHFSPDRLQHPLARKDGKLVEIGWAEAHERLAAVLTGTAERPGAAFGLVTGEMSGHGAWITQRLIEAMGPAARHYAVETVAQASARRAHLQVAGIATPEYHLDEAALVLAVGADPLGTWGSPMLWSKQYAGLRKAPRGSLIAVETKMSVTGANADWWCPIRAGSEGWLLFGLARWLIERDPAIAARLPEPALREALGPYGLASVAAQTDITAENIERMAQALHARQPSLVLVGGPAEHSEQGQRHVEAGWLLNHLLGNVGKTVTAPAVAAHAELAVVPGSSAALVALGEALPSLEAVLVWGANPVYGSPHALGLRERFQQARQRVAFAVELDETSALADLVIPVRSPLEDWGTHLPQINPKPGLMQIQQPVMEPLHADLPSASALLLGLLARLKPQSVETADHHAWLRSEVMKLRPEAEQIGPRPYKLPALLDPPAFKPALPEEVFAADELDRAFWEATVARGLLQLPVEPARPLALRPRVTALRTTAGSAASADAGPDTYPYALIVTPRVGLHDGRHANRPWLQELPDPLTTVVWDSWAEIHPETAAKLGLAQGDLVELESAHGRLKVKVALFPGLHPASIAVPLGQGRELGRYARGIGVNPLAILAPLVDGDSGELALCATRVQARKAGREHALVRMAPTEYQHGRRFVRTVPARTLGPDEQV